MAAPPVNALVGASPSPDLRSAGVGPPSAAGGDIIEDPTKGT